MKLDSNSGVLGLFLSNSNSTKHTRTHLVNLSSRSKSLLTFVSLQDYLLHFATSWLAGTTRKDRCKRSKYQNKKYLFLCLSFSIRKKTVQTDKNYLTPWTRISRVNGTSSCLTLVVRGRNEEANRGVFRLTTRTSRRTSSLNTFLKNWVWRRVCLM